MGTRRERVILELQDDLSSGMAKAAVATRLLGRQLDSLEGQSVAVSRATGTASRDIDRLSTSAVRGGNAIDQYSGRLGILLKSAALLGPALAPIGAVGIAGVAGLASQLGFASAGALSLIVAFQGVGDALDAVNTAALEPTADNLAKAQEAMAKIGPEAQAFVSRFQELRPVLNDLRDSAAAGWFPGLTDSLDSLESAAPRLESLLFAVSKAGGDAIADGAESLAGPRWAEFISFIEAEAPDAITALSQTVGSLTHGLAELWMAFDPANDGVRDWLVDAAAGFDEWASGLAETEGFKEFIEYLNTNGPKVAEAAAAIGNALVQIVQAAAPLGGPVLDALTGIANAIALIADSPLGTPIMAGVAAMSALSLATNVATAALGRFKVAQAAVGMGGVAGAPGSRFAVGPGAALGGGIVINQIVASQGENMKDSTGDINFLQASPFNAMEALLSWDADKWTGSDVIKRIFTGPDEGAIGSTNRLVDRVLALGDAFDTEATAAERAEAANRRLAQSYTDVNAILSKQGAWDGYQASLDSMTESIERNGKTLDANTEAGRENRANLNAIAESAVRYADSLKGAERSDFLKGAIRNYKDAAEAAGGLDARARDVLRGLKDLAAIEARPKIGLDTANFDNKRRATDRALGDLNTAKPEPAVKLNTGGFNQAVNHVENLLNSLNGKTATTFVVTRHMTKGQGSSTAAYEGRVSADGSTVPKDGGPYADRYPYLLAPGEEVISNRRGQADRFRPLLKAINAGALADGGTAGKGRRNLDYLGSNGMVMLPGGASAELSLFVGGIKAINRALERSEQALDKETSARDDVVSSMQSLSSSVSERFLSEFGETDAWSSGGTFQDTIARLTGDTSAAKTFNANRSALSKKGLNGPALEALLSQADDQTIANFANLTAAQLDQYEQQFAARASAAAVAGSGAGNAVFGAQLAASNAHLVQLTAEVRVLQQIQKAASKDNVNAQAKAADSNKRGKGNAARSVKKGARLG